MPSARRSPPLAVVAAVCVLISSALPAPRAAAHDPEDAPARPAGLPIEDGRCGDGDPIAPTLAIDGSFPHDIQGATVMVPFEVPPGTTSVRVKYCWHSPETPAPGGNHTIDLGL